MVLRAFKESQKESPFTISQKEASLKNLPNPLFVPVMTKLVLSHDE